MKFIFIGGENGDGPDISTHYGVRFVKNGEAVEVPAEVEGKFSGNCHFLPVYDNGDGQDFIPSPKKRGRPRKAIDDADNC